MDEFSKTGEQESETEPEVSVVDGLQIDAASARAGIFAAIGALPAGAVVTEDGLAKMWGKCKASIKAAVERGELPRPVRLMGKNSWTAGSIIRFHEQRMEVEARRYARLRV